MTSLQQDGDQLQRKKSQTHLWCLGSDPKLLNWGNSLVYLYQPSHVEIQTFKLGQLLKFPIIFQPHHATNN